MNTDYIAWVIRDTANEFFPDNKKILRKKEFEEKSYRMSAVESVIDLIKNSKDPCKDVETMMNKFKKRQAIDLYRVYFEIYEFALDIMNGMKGVDDERFYVLRRDNS